MAKERVQENLEHPRRKGRKIHSLRAKAFYTLPEEEADTLITFSFDSQKNMALPKLSYQAAYFFSRQLNLYDFTIVQGASKTSLKKETIFMYLWTEQQRPKGCNDISSAVFNQLSNTNYSTNLTKDIHTYHQDRVFALRCRSGLLLGEQSEVFWYMVKLLTDLIYAMRALY